jgi:hypothetical protein
MTRSFDPTFLVPVRYLSGFGVYQDLELLKREITELQSESKAGMPKGSL